MPRRPVLTVALFGVRHQTQRGLWVLPLPADDGWPNTGCYGFSPDQTARPSTLLVYAHRCGRFERLAKGLKAYKTMFPKACGQLETAGLSLCHGRRPLSFSMFTGVGRCQKAR